ncbi:MAG: MBL fold metallo-hydrolase [Firmicutes bacterium]|nr:MBL fold metallo-hydrolase [Bacillota bacterium]
MKVTCIANAGVLIEFGREKLLVDAVHGPEVTEIYTPTEEAFLDRLAADKPPFQGIKRMFFTHHHPDHFSPERTYRILSSRPDIRVMADEETIYDIFQYCRDRNLPLPNAQTMSVPWRFPGHFSLGEGEFKVEVVSFLHEGEVYTGVPMIGYIFEIEGKTIFVAGDARLSKGNMEAFPGPVDVAILPFPFVGTGRGCELITEYIKPGQVVAVHVPEPERDRDHFVDFTLKYYEKVKDQIPPVHFLMHPYESVKLE